MYATIKYDFETLRFIAILDDADAVRGSAEEAVQNLRDQANKHNLWPDGQRY